MRQPVTAVTASIPAQRSNEVLEAAMTIHENVTLPFRDRVEAGRFLSARLRAYSGRPDTIVFALPRGGVPVAAEIAESLRVPLFVFVVRKLGVPGRPELAMGAITSGGKRLINEAVTIGLQITERDIDEVAWCETQELQRREKLYARGRRLPNVKDKIIILVDDGIATGSSMMLAVQALREQGAGRIVVAVPVAPSGAVSQLSHLADEVVCLAEPEPFTAVGQWYRDFSQVDDHEVCCTLDRLFERNREPLSA
jgi:predicted phosphoribosyltransferase